MILRSRSRIANKQLTTLTSTDLSEVSRPLTQDSLTPSQPPVAVASSQHEVQQKQTRVVGTKQKFKAACRQARDACTTLDKSRVENASTAVKVVSEVSAFQRELKRQMRLQLAADENDQAEAEYRELLRDSSEEDMELLRTIDAFDAEIKKTMDKIEREEEKLAAANAKKGGFLTTDFPVDAIPNFKGTLKPFQQDGVSFLCKTMLQNNLNGILADEMGLGKTVQTIAFLHLMFQQGHREPVLIVAPLSTIPHWVDEIQRFSGEPSLRVESLTGESSNRDAVVNRVVRSTKKNVVILVASHDHFSRPLKGAQRKLITHQWSCLVVDEAQRIKDAGCALHKTLVKVKSQYRLTLSGTPLQNTFNEMFALLSFALPHIFAKHEKELLGYLDVALSKGANYSASGDENAEEQAMRNREKQVLLCKRVHRILQPFVMRRERKDVLVDLPKKDEHRIICPVTNAQQTAISALFIDETSTTNDDDQHPALSWQKPKKATTVSNAVISARKILIHPYTMAEEFKIDEDIVHLSGKFAALDKMMPFLLEHGHRCVIFSLWTTVLDVVETLFLYRQWSYVRLDGNVKFEKRQERLREFNDTTSADSAQCFLISKVAGGVGLNLQKADTVILLDIDYNPQRDNQALSRVYRIGQQAHVKVFWLQTDTSIEQRMAHLANCKTLIEQKVIHAGLFNTSSTTADREERLNQVVDSEFSASVNTPNALAGPSFPSSVADNNARQIDHLEDQLAKCLARTAEEQAVVADYVNRAPKRKRMPDDV